jgi:hypothetical protein
VGNHGTHLVGEAFRQYNFVHTADRLKYRNQLNTTVPIANYFSGTALEALTKIWGPETQLSQLLMDYPAFGGIQNNVAFDGTSIYHGMNVTCRNVSRTDLTSSRLTRSRKKSPTRRPLIWPPC